MSITDSSTGQAGSTTLTLDAATAAGYQAKFTPMFARLQSNPTELEAFLANPRPALEAAGIPVGATPPVAGPLDSYQCTVSTSWWGFSITMNESLTQAVITGTETGGPLAAAITAALAAAGVLTGGIATAIGAGFGAAFALKRAEIKLIDNGNGVYWPVTWVQLAAVVAAVPTGPAGIVAAIMIFIHPVAN